MLHPTRTARYIISYLIQYIGADVAIQRIAHKVLNVMAQNGLGYHPQTASHIPHDSALSVGSSNAEDAAKLRDLEDEVKVLAEKANVACR